MANQNVKQQVDEAIETLEALYFFTQGLKNETAEHVEKVRAIYGYLLEAGYPNFLADLQRDIQMLREHYGAKPPDERQRRTDARMQNQGLGWLQAPRWRGKTVTQISIAKTKVGPLVCPNRC